eukprot:SAG22_NODE_2029_length_3114_cov_13.372471_2_plen_88_part_00
MGWHYVNELPYALEGEGISTTDVRDVMWALNKASEEALLAGLGDQYYDRSTGECDAEQYDKAVRPGVSETPRSQLRHGVDERARRKW